MACRLNPKKAIASCTCSERHPEKTVHLARGSAGQTSGKAWNRHSETLGVRGSSDTGLLTRASFPQLSPCLLHFLLGIFSCRLWPWFHILPASLLGRAFDSQKLFIGSGLCVDFPCTTSLASSDMLHNDRWYADFTSESVCLLLFLYTNTHFRD